MLFSHLILFFFFFNDTATTEIYTLSLHDALPISQVLTDLYTIWLEKGRLDGLKILCVGDMRMRTMHSILYALSQFDSQAFVVSRSEEHTSELQSRQYLVCRLLLEKKKKIKNRTDHADGARDDVIEDQGGDPNPLQERAHVFAHNNTHGGALRNASRIIQTAAYCRR